MGAAVAVHEPAERPGWLEKLLVLGICAGLFVAVHAADQRGRERNEARAREVLAERAQRAAARANRETMTGPAAAARTQGDGSSIVLPGGISFGGPPAATRTAPAKPVAATEAAPAEPAGRDDAGSILLLLMGAAGLSMCGAGLKLLSRPSA